MNVAFGGIFAVKNILLRVAKVLDQLLLKRLCVVDGVVELWPMVIGVAGKNQRLVCAAGRGQFCG